MPTVAARGSMYPNLEEELISFSFSCLSVSAKRGVWAGLPQEPLCRCARMAGQWAVQPLQELMASPVSVFTAKILSSSGVGDQPARGTKLIVTISFYVKPPNCEITQPPGLLIPVSTRERLVPRTFLTARARCCPSWPLFLLLLLKQIT